jgi:hypothetical protein
LISFPEVWRSILGITLISADLPLPDLPMIAANVPASICKSMPAIFILSPRQNHFVVAVSSQVLPRNIPCCVQLQPYALSQ